MHLDTFLKRLSEPEWELSCVEFVATTESKHWGLEGLWGDATHAHAKAYVQIIAKSLQLIELQAIVAIHVIAPKVHLAQTFQQSRRVQHRFAKGAGHCRRGHR